MFNSIYNSDYGKKMNSFFKNSFAAKSASFYYYRRTHIISCMYMKLSEQKYQNNNCTTNSSKAKMLKWRICLFST